MSFENRVSSASEPPMIPIGAASYTPPMWLIQLFLRHPCDLFDAPSMKLPVGMINASVSMSPARPIGADADMEKEDNEWSSKQKRWKNVMHSNIKMHMLK